MSENNDKVTVIFEGQKESWTIESITGKTILEIAHENNIPIEGACEGSLACSTCHVILEQKVYNELPEPTEAEEDMLDLAFNLSHTSRLGCQIVVTKELDGMVIKLPFATRNIML